MNDFNDIGKQMPYTESEDYLNRLIETSTETAIAQQQPKVRTRRIQWIGVAASVAIVVAIGITYVLRNTQAQVVTPTTESPLDDFLCNLSDEDAQMIEYYEIEDIPEY